MTTLDSIEWWATAAVFVGLVIVAAGLVLFLSLLIGCGIMVTIDGLLGRKGVGMEDAIGAACKTFVFALILALTVVASARAAKDVIERWPIEQREEL